MGKFNIHFLFPFFAILGFVIIINLNKFDSVSIFHQAIPALMVVLYSTILFFGYLHAETDQWSDHLIDSTYFLGFLFTLITIFSIFFQYDLLQIQLETDQQNINLVINNIGFALSTTIIGLLCRYVLQTYQLEKGMQLDRDAAGELSKYTNSFAGYTESLDGLSETIKNINKDSTELTEKLNEQIKSQHDKLKGSTESLINFQQSVSRVNTNLDDLGTVVTNIQGFNENISGLKSALNDFCELLEHKVKELHPVKSPQ